MSQGCRLLCILMHCVCECWLTQVPIISEAAAGCAEADLLTGPVSILGILGGGQPPWPPCVGIVLVPVPGRMFCHNQIWGNVLSPAPGSGHSVTVLREAGPRCTPANQTPVGTTMSGGLQGWDLLQVLGVWTFILRTQVTTPNIGHRGGHPWPWSTGLLL